MQYLLNIISWCGWPHDSRDAIVPDIELGNQPPEGRKFTKIEQYRAGYPRFSALISGHPNFFVHRRFLRLRARLLLLQQDKIAQLEDQLDEIDRTETRLLYLGKARCDRNADRSHIVSEIGSHLADYDSLLESTSKTLLYNDASQRDVASLQNWIANTSCLSRDETQYLEHERELLTLASCNDSAIKRLESWVEDAIIRSYKDYRALPLHDLSTDPNVFIYSGPLVKRLAHALMLFLITSLLLTPVVICTVIYGVWGRILVIITSTICYLAILSGLTKSRMIDLVLAGATFATILTVFISGVDNSLT